MAAIRAAGGVKGAKLRKVEAAEEEGGGGERREEADGRRKEERGKEERGKAERGTEEPEDLMSSLAKALEMRRRGENFVKIGDKKGNVILKNWQKNPKILKAYRILRFSH